MTLDEQVNDLHPRQSSKAVSEPAKQLLNKYGFDVEQKDNFINIRANGFSATLTDTGMGDYDVTAEAQHINFPFMNEVNNYLQEMQEEGLTPLGKQPFAVSRQYDGQVSNPKVFLSGLIRQNPKSPLREILEASPNISLKQDQISASNQLVKGASRTKVWKSEAGTIYEKSDGGVTIKPNLDNPVMRDYLGDTHMEQANSDESYMVHLDWAETIVRAEEFSNKYAR